jgi:hypothetical protein
MRFCHIKKHKIMCKKKFLFFSTFFHLFSLFFVLILFIQTKTTWAGFFDFLQLLQSIQYHSPVILHFFLGINTCVVAMVLWKSSFQTVSKWLIIRWGFILLLLFISVFPLGNYLKHGTFFYEKWFWYCVISLLGMYCYVGFVLLQIERSTFLFDLLQPLVTNIDKKLVRSTRKRFDWIFIVCLSLWVFVLTLMLNQWLFGGYPHIQDSVAQMFQAKIFACGYLTAPNPKYPEFFERIYIVSEGGAMVCYLPSRSCFTSSIGGNVPCSFFGECDNLNAYNPFVLFIYKTNFNVV